MREFVFTDKCKVEMDIITDVLDTENIPYKLKKYLIKDIIFCDDEDDDFIMVEELYNIHCFTDLDHFDFVKHIAYKKIEDKVHLERNFLLPAYKRKVRKTNVQRVYKKNITNTNSNDRK